jgi:hypothetical protein
MTKQTRLKTHYVVHYRGLHLYKDLYETEEAVNAFVEQGFVGRDMFSPAYLTKPPGEEEMEQLLVQMEKLSMREGEVQVDQFFLWAHLSEICASLQSIHYQCHVVWDCN